MRILLVNTWSRDDIFTTVVTDIPYISCMLKDGRGASFAPHALVTLAALTPREHEIRIHDEHLYGPVEQVIEDGDFDVVGVGMMTNQLNRVLQICEFCKEKGLGGHIVVGGPGTSNIPTALRAAADTIFFGEAEVTWSQFLTDLAAGCPKDRYEQPSRPDLTDVPPPRWELIRDDIRAYGATSVQTTRGCPFDCEFCDVVYIYGRKPRSKTVPQVISEIRVLAEMGSRMILFADDNFSANKTYAKAVLRELFTFCEEQETPLSFITQADITMADDEELLELMADCNFIEVLIGIESIDAAALREMNKRQNMGTDILAAVQKIQSYGIAVLGSMIAGADTDDLGVFARTEEFVKAAPLVDHALHPMMAPSGTKLWYRMKREGRLVELGPEQRDRLDTITNIVPKQIDRVELLEALADYWERVFSPLHYMERALRFVEGVTYRPRIRRRPKMTTFWRYRKMMFRMYWYYKFEVSAEHRKAFFSIMKKTRKCLPRLMPQMVFLHTSFLVSHRRAVKAAQRARKQAAHERANPGSLRLADPNLPVPTAVREQASDIFGTAYARVRERVPDRGTLYEVVVQAAGDYVDRFGGELDVFDERHNGYLVESCDRALAGVDVSGAAADDLPDQAPAGFARDILDALDHRLRTRASAPA